MNLKDLRKQISQIDKKLVQLLNQRAGIAVKIGQQKKKSNISSYQPSREKQVLDSLLKESKGPLSDEALRSIYGEIFSVCLKLQQTLTIAYLGPEATFTHQAAKLKFGSAPSYKHLRSIGEVFWDVEKGSSDMGVVPVENSIEGVETHTLDMFVESDLKICAEIFLPVSQCLLSKAKKEEIKVIYSHPQALAQCRGWIQENLPRAELEEVYSTAQAAKLAARRKESAAIASELASILYSLPILGKNIEDKLGNVTRFLVIGKEESAPAKESKTSLLFSLKDRVGALHNSLKPFASHNINLTKIESRPSKRKLWEYYFFVDFVGHWQEERVKKTLEELKESCTFLKILGSYPKG